MITSTLRAHGETIATWDSNEHITTWFSRHADDFHCDGDDVVLTVTRETIEQMMTEIEDFLQGIHPEGRWTTPLHHDDDVFEYRERVTI